MTWLSNSHPFKMKMLKVSKSAWQKKVLDLTFICGGQRVKAVHMESK
jgi:hypothetical protein